MGVALRQAWATTTDAADWTWGMLQGDFNEDPTVGQIITNAVVTAIPVVDQVGDARDIAAGVKMLAWDQRYDEPGVWMDNGFTLVGLFPGVGSLLKGVLKLVDKLAGLDQILAVYNHFVKGNGVKWLKELKAGKLKAYYDQAATKAHAIFAAAIDNLVRLKQHMPRNLAELHARADSLLAALRRTKAKINDQFRRMGRGLAQKLEAILAKRTDELPAGAAKSKVQKQQRAEAPEDKREGPNNKHDDPKKRMALGMKLSDEVEEEAKAISTKGSPRYLSNSTRGPVLTGVMDPKTEEIFYGLNAGMVPDDLHPVLRQRLDSYLESTGGITPPRAGVPGSHSEIVALDKAIKAREATSGIPLDESDLTDFLLHNRSLIGERRAIGIPPRCLNCAAITDGIEVVGGN